MKDYIDRLKLYLSSRKRAYELTFTDSPSSQIVLSDLARFCRADKSTFHKDARASAVLQGRREVWLRIQNYLQLTPEELVELQRKGKE